MAFFMANQLIIFFNISGAPFMDMVYFPEHEQVALIFSS
jgi:hypothetical protein